MCCVMSVGYKDRMLNLDQFSVISSLIRRCIFHFVNLMPLLILVVESRG